MTSASSMASSQSAPPGFIANMLARQGPGLIGVTGPAGAGKSAFSAALAAKGAGAFYAADARFIGDSLERRALLAQKQSRSLVEFRDAANQFNWWDWAAIERDLTALASGSRVVIPAPYDRASGQKSSDLVIEPRPHILYEGALLGPPHIVHKLKTIVFLCVPAPVRFERIAAKDAGRRSFNEILARFLITEYSETTYYRQLFAWARGKIVFIDGVTGQPCAPFTLADDLFVPVRMTPESA